MNTIIKLDLQAFDQSDIDSIMSSLEYSSYAANRGYGMSHNDYMSLFPNWSPAKKAMFQAIYNNEMENDNGLWAND